MEETTVAIATADVVTYDEVRKQWHPPDGCAEPARSHVRILHNTQTNNFRIVATRINDGECVMNFKIFERLKYKPSTLMFHQWRDEKRQVFGLNFVSEEEARSFIKVMTRALNVLSSAADYQYSADVGLSNGVYQEPQQLHHNAHSTPSFRENDEESLCSSTVPNNASNFRKASQPVQCSTNGGGMLGGLTLTNVQQRRASQGSSSSSNGSAVVGAFHISAAVQNAATVGSPSRSTGLSMLTSGNGAEGATATHSAAVSSSAPPPAPPPPPPLSALMMEKKNGSSMAEQIKNVQLRKVSSVSSNISNGLGRGREDLFSELEERLNKRKNQAEGDSSAVGSSSTVRRPWDKQLFSSQNGGSSVNDSPKTHRKVPSVSSLSSQDEPRVAIASGTNSAAAVPSVNSSQAVSNNAVNNSAYDGNLTQVDLIEKLKREILGEVLKEINNAKMEIIEVIRSEIRRM